MVYFILNKQRGAVKIGYSLAPSARLADLSVASPDPLVILGTIDGNTDDERRLHRRFAAHRLRGEWFAAAPEVMEGIAALLRSEQEPAIEPDRDGLRWCMNQGAQINHAPEWCRQAALAPDGTVFVPAAIAGEEDVLVMVASFDGASLLHADGHLYLPSSWMAREYPDAVEVCRLIERRVFEFFGVTAAPT